MKKLIFTVLISLFLFSGIAHAIGMETIECTWFWTTSFASTTADPPDAVWCRKNGGTWSNAGASYTQLAAGADDITVTWDTDIADGSTTMTTLVPGSGATIICSNAGATVNLEVLASADNSQFSEGGVYYYEAASLADEDANTFSMTHVRYFKLAATEASGTAACMVAHTAVTWIQR